LWYDLDAYSPTVVIMAKPIKQEKFDGGIRLMVSSFRSDELSPLSRIKHTGILWKVMARAEARRVGMDDALLLNTKGHISEATAANIFWTRDKKLFTPSLDCGILAGITRAIVIEIADAVGIETAQGHFTIEELFNADEVFLTSSTRELVPVRLVGEKQYGEVAPGSMTRLLASLYQERLPS
ncbi:MAG: aminotransferase class IV, partial [Armatimonadota bacterium]|nr:aminotransferase class IV [Armatimonadota bacterium]